MARVDRERGENREDVRLEQSEEIGPLLALELVDARQVKARLGQARHDRCLEDIVASHLQAQALGADVLELLHGGPPVGGLGPQPGCHMVFEPAHTHLEELVQAGGQDGEELDSLEQGERSVRGQVH